MTIDLTSEPIARKIAAAWPPERWGPVRVVVAVSGGADSVALLRMLAALRPSRAAGELYVAHFHHGLRAGAADEDQAFVEQLAERLGLRCLCGRANVSDLARREGDGIEAAARDARYAFLFDTARRIGARYVATAHTADDQIETVLHRIVRGTGLGGLAGIPPFRAVDESLTLARPMLGVRRDEVLALLDLLEQPFCDDASNRDMQFTRNRLRYELLPLLAERFNPSVDQALLRLAELASEWQTTLERLTGSLLDRALVVQTADRVELNVEPLRPVEPYLVRQMLIDLWTRQGWPRQAMDHGRWSLLAEMTFSRDEPAPGGRKHIFPGNIVAERQPERLILLRGE